MARPAARFQRTLWRRGGGRRLSATGSVVEFPYSSLCHLTLRWAARRAAKRTVPVPEMNMRRSLLLDDLIRPSQERLWDRQPERLGRLEVDHQLDLGRLLHGQVARLGTLEDAVHVGGSAPVQILRGRP